MIWATLSYEARDKFRSWDPSEWTAFLEVWPLPPSTKIKALERAPEDRYYAITTEPVRLDYQEASYIQLQFGIKVEVEAWNGAQITKMKGAEMRYGPPSATDLMAGRAVQISVPDDNLMKIRQVTHLDDCCTDELQKHLDDGWRILAVCPPNAQRRPDYILGRT